MKHFIFLALTFVTALNGQLPTTDDCTQRTYLVRHGESTANVYFEVDGKKVRYVSGQSLEIPLTDTGIIQITELAEKLANSFSRDAKLVILSSSAKRTQQTAKILFQQLSKTHPHVTLADETYEKLNERSLGAWEGQLRDEKFEEAQDPWKKLSAADKFITPEVVGAESYRQVATRAVSAMSEIYEKYSDNTIIAVTSFNTINAAAIEISHGQASLFTEPGSDLPKFDLGNGDLVLFETDRSIGFPAMHLTSHIKR
jgi:broad specificity phosphatase PhoE